MKILLLDIETAPNLVHSWGLWEQNIGINQIIKAGYTLCYAAKWYESNEVCFDSINQSSPKKMLKGLHALLEEADAVVHYNGDKFDIPTINKDFVSFGLLPPSPAKQMDLLKTVKLKFRFPSNKLDYVAQALGLGKKVKHEGHELWIKCMEGDADAWKRMETYNIQDVLLLEQLYTKIKPWIKHHVNYSLHSAGNLVCPRCGSTKHQKRGFTNTLASRFQRYQCSNCGGWFKDNIILNRKDYKTSEIA
jgi:DNA polymerase elongation subunit (family B)